MTRLIPFPCTLALRGVLMPALAAVPLLAAGAGTPGNVDTGIRPQQCFRGGDDALVDCGTTDLPAQDGAVGRDTDARTRHDADGTLGFAFARLCNSGLRAGEGTCPDPPALGDGPDDWGCLEDKLTGMMWEVKALTGFRARDLRYTNYSPDYDPVGEYGSPTDATGFIARLNAAKLCGFHDWNLGHSAKIQIAVDYGVAAEGALRADERFFPTLNVDWYWNASPNPTSPSTAFAVDFATGAISNAAERGTPRFVQAVRDAKETVGPNGRYEVRAEGTEVRDTTSFARLTWRRCVEGMAWDGRTCAGSPALFTQEQALRHAAKEAAATGEAWRVPSVKELNSLVMRKLASPAIDHAFFPATPPAPTWTSTPEVRLPSTAWSIDFDKGTIAAPARDQALVLRLARDPVALGVD